MGEWVDGFCIGRSACLLMPAAARSIVVHTAAVHSFCKQEAGYDVTVPILKQDFWIRIRIKIENLDEDSNEIHC